MDNYFQVSFGYAGLHCGASGPTQEASDVLQAASSKVEDALIDLGHPFGMAYLWPDGSMYYYLALPEGLEPETVLKGRLPSDIWVEKAWGQDPDRKLWPDEDEGPTVREAVEKYFATTLAERESET